jgi:hypothetical protein
VFRDPSRSNTLSANPLTSKSSQFNTNGLKATPKKKSILKVNGSLSPANITTPKSPLANKFKQARSKLNFMSKVTRSYSGVSPTSSSLKFQKYHTKIKNKKKAKEKASSKDCFCEFFKYLFFVNIPPLFEITKKRKLDRADLGALPPHLRAKNLIKDFERIYYTELDKSSNRVLWKSIFRFSKKEILLAITLRLISDLIMISVPLLIRQYAKGLKAFSGGEDFAVSTLILRLFIVLVAILFQDLTREHSMKKIALCGTKTGQALRAVLFEKLIAADYNFLNIADPSFLSRLILFEFT